MDSLSLIYLIVVVIFFIAGISNIIFSVIKYRKKSIDDYIKGKEQRKKDVIEGKE